MRTPSASIVGLGTLAVVGGLALPSAAFAQASRTWVSATGDDANPCSRTAPCRTFASAISKTATSGEIDVLDPGTFGTVTITKAITIDGKGFVSSVTASGTNGITVNAGTAKVSLRNLSLQGLGTGIAGVRILAATTVRIVNTTISGFSTGIVDAPSTGRTRVVVQNTSIHDNSVAGVSIVPTGGTTTTARVTMRGSSVDDNGDGLVADGTSGRVAAYLFHNSIADNGSSSGTGIGIHTIANAGVRIGDNDITGNLIGLQSDPGSTIDSLLDNNVIGNNVNGAPTGTLAKS